MGAVGGVEPEGGEEEGEEEEGEEEGHCSA